MLRLLSRATAPVLLVALLLAGGPAWAQTPAAATTGTLSASAATVTATVATSPSAVFQVSGTWVGTITFEGSASGDAWTTMAVVKGSTAAAVTTTTANDVFILANPGYHSVRARMSSYTSGMAFVTIRGGYGATSAQAASMWTGQATTLTAGANGTAGTVRIYPATASKGYVDFTITDQTGNTTVTNTFAAMGQATTLTVPDPGAAAASYVLTGGAQTIGGVKTFSAIPVFPTTGITLNATTISEAEIGVLDSVTAGTAAASKAVVLDGSLNVASINNLTTSGLSIHALGAVGAPSITFTGDPNTGVYSAGADTLDFTTGGTRAGGFSSGQIFSTTSEVQSGSHIKLPATSSLYWNGRSALYSGADGTAQFTNSTLTGFTGIDLGPTTGNTASGTLSIKKVVITCTIASDTGCTGKGTGTITTTTGIPAGSLVLGVDARVTTILAGSDGIASWALGHAGDADAWGAALALAATTTTGVANFTVTAPGYFTGATNLTITGTGGKIIDSGEVKITIYYIALTAIGV